MNLIGISNQIVTKLIESDVLKLEELMISVEVDKELEENKKDLILAVVENFVKNGTLTKIKDKDVWILRQSVRNVTQKVEISLQTADEIAEIINSFLDAEGETSIRVDKLNISEMEIATLLSVLNQSLLDQHQNNDKDL